MKKLCNNKVWGISIAVELLLVIIGIVFLVGFESKTINVNINDWNSGVTSYDDGWTVSPEDFGEGEESINMLYGPNIHLDRGSYTATIEYLTDEKQEVQAYAAYPNESFVRGGKGFLRNSSNTMTYKFDVMHSIDNFELLFKYNGQGNTYIRNISITTNSLMTRRMVFKLGALFVLINLIIIFKKKNVLGKVIKIVLIALVPSIPLGVLGIHVGHDFLFHLARMEGIAQDFALGELPVSISSFWLGGYGYPVSIYYGDVLLYFPAILRNCGIPVVEAYKWFIFMTNLLTAAIAYYSFNKIFKRENLAMILSFLYCTANYRLIDIYARSAVGEFCAIIFLPLVAAAAYGLYTDEISDKVKYYKNALLLAVGMTGIIQTHILSTEMVVVVLGIVCLIMYKKTFRKHTIIAYGSAVVMTVIMNIGFLVPFFDYYANVPVKINQTSVDSFNAIQCWGAYWGQYFVFTQKISGLSSTLSSERFALTPGLTLMLGFVAAVYILYKYKGKYKDIVLYTALSGAILFLSSAYFPWDYIAASGKIGNMLAQIMLPWRYLAFAILTLTMLFGTLMTRFVEEKNYDVRIVNVVRVGIIFITFISVSAFSSEYMSTSYIVNYNDTADVFDDSIMGEEYILNGSHSYSLAYNLEFDGIDTAYVMNRHGKTCQIYVDGGTETGQVTFPVFNYKGYEVVDRDGNRLEVMNGDNNRVKVLVPPEYEGTMELHFVTPIIWIVADIVQYIVWIAVTVLLIIYRSKKKSDDIAGTIE